MWRFLSRVLPRWPARLRKPGPSELVCAGLALVCLILPEWWMASRNRAEREKELELLLQASIETKRESVRQWAAGLRAEAGWWAASAPVRSAVERQLRLPPDPDELRQSAALVELRRVFSHASEGAGPRAADFSNFLIVNPDGLLVASRDDASIGGRYASGPDSPWQAALRTGVRLAPLGVVPQMEGREFPEADRDPWTALIVAPVRDRGGSVIAALGFRVDVAGDLASQVLAEGKGRVATPYAYSKFHHWLNEASPGRPDPAPIARAAREPPLPPVSKIVARLSTEPGPSPGSIQDRVIFNLQGYRGCRGQRVVGARGAVPELGLGLLVEIGFDKAYASVSRTRWTLIGLAIILGLSLVLVVLNQTAPWGAGEVDLRQSRRNSAAWAILAVSLLATGLAWLSTKAQVDEHERGRFEREVELVRKGLVERFERYGEAVGAIHAASQAVGTVEPAEWTRLVRSYKGRPGFRDVRCLAFIESRPQQPLADSASDARRPAAGAYPVHPAVPASRDSALKYTEPGGECRHLLGSDDGSLEVVRAAAEQARDSAQTRITGPLPMWSSSGRERSILMLAPVYSQEAKGLPLEGRRASLRGWVQALIPVTTMLQDLPGTAPATVGLEVFDGTNLDRDSLLYDDDSVLETEPGRHRARLRRTVAIEAGGRLWTLSFTSQSGFESAVTRSHPAQVLLGGLAISVLLFDIALVLSSTRSRALAIAGLMTQRFRDGEARVRAVIDQAPDGIITFDRHGVVQTFNPGAEKLFGYTAVEANGLTIQTFMPAALTEEVNSLLAAGGPDETGPDKLSAGREWLGKRKDGATFPAELTVSRMQLGGGLMFTAIVRDVSERQGAEAALRESEQRYALAARATSDGLWDWDLRENEVYFSPRWKAMLGLNENDAVKRPEDWLDRVHADDLNRLRVKLADHLEGRTAHFESEHRMLHADGIYRWMLTRGIAVRDETGDATRIAGSQTDVTDRKQAERQLLYDALHDPLTGLPNRTFFMGQLERAAQQLQTQPNRLFAILFLDLDRFKLVNDSMGHFVGDQLLIVTADRLKVCLRPGDTIARLGGDEFAVLVENLTDAGDATRIADRIQKQLALPFRVRDQEVFTTVSIGITLSGSGDQAAEDLLRDADTAMYRAKAQGKARYELFDQGMHTRAVEFLLLETALRKALDREELRVYYQPIISLTTGQIVRCEALLRWQHPERGLVFPKEFIPVAEETGLINSMSAWLLRTACAQTKAWRDAGLPALRLAVNISPRQLKQQDLFHLVTRTLSETELDPAALELELTESALMECTDTTTKPLVELYDQGVRISLDDFGTGYSSLMYLRRFPISTLKIDSSFIREITSDPSDAAIACGLIALAHSLSLQVTAEGVETAEQLAFLRNKECDEIQGNLISAAVDSAACSALLHRGVDLSALSQVQGTARSA